jgi:hypothetical protein
MQFSGAEENPARSYGQLHLGGRKHVPTWQPGPLFDFIKAKYCRGSGIHFLGSPQRLLIHLAMFTGEL